MTNVVISHDATSPYLDSTKLRTVYPGKQSELYEIAESALFDGDGTFTDGGRLWQVGDGKPGQYLDIWPEVQQPKNEALTRSDDVLENKS